MDRFAIDIVLEGEKQKSSISKKSDMRQVFPALNVLNFLLTGFPFPLF